MSVAIVTPPFFPGAVEQICGVLGTPVAYHSTDHVTIESIAPSSPSSQQSTVSALL
jgi:hypothetical protein